MQCWQKQFELVEHLCPNLHWLGRRLIPTAVPTKLYAHRPSNAIYSSQELVLFLGQGDQNAPGASETGAHLRVTEIANETGRCWDGEGGGSGYWLWQRVRQLDGAHRLRQSCTGMADMGGTSNSGRGGITKRRRTHGHGSLRCAVLRSLRWCCRGRGTQQRCSSRPCGRGGLGRSCSGGVQCAVDGNPRVRWPCRAVAAERTFLHRHVFPCAPLKRVRPLYTHRNSTASISSLHCRRPKGIARGLARSNQRIQGVQPPHRHEGAVHNQKKNGD